MILEKTSKPVKTGFYRFPGKNKFLPAKASTAQLSYDRDAKCKLFIAQPKYDKCPESDFSSSTDCPIWTWSESLNRWGARLQNFSGSWKITEIKNRNKSELFLNHCPYKQIQFPISVKTWPVPRIFEIWQLPTTLYCPPPPPICTKKWLGFQSTTPTRISCIHSIVYYNTISRSTTPVRIRSTPKRRDSLWSGSGAMTEKSRSTC